MVHLLDKVIFIFIHIFENKNIEGIIVLISVSSLQFLKGRAPFLSRVKKNEVCMENK